jgi:endonuclease I
MIKALDAQMDADAKDVNYSFSYRGMFSVWAFTDADKSKSGNIRSFYSGTSAAPSACNREHVWPNSRQGESTETDPHVLRPALVSENSSRGNSFYGETTGWDPATFSNPKYRGIAARIIFYAAVRYQDSGLWLEDADNPTSTNSNQRPTMGKLSLLLKWNLQYPVDETETQRNEVLYTKYNFCRNVFIDRPEYATKIWGNVNSACKTACGL